MSKFKISERGVLFGLNPTMGVVSMVTILGFVCYSILMPTQAKGLFEGMKGWVESTLGWYYILLLSVVVFFAFYLLFSRWGNIRLGQDDSRPEFSNFTWFSMLFGCGTGIGLLFFGVAEPLWHYQGNPFVSEAHQAAVAAGMASTEAVEAAKISLRLTLFHWGLHGWALYAIIGLALAYFSFRKNLPLTIRSALYPIFGDRIYGPIGHVADILAVFGTIFGLSTTLGMGAAQINTGLDVLFGIEKNISNQILIIVLVSAMATISAVTGLARGVKILSLLNSWLCIGILGFILLMGPTIYILGALITGVGDYIQQVIPLGMWNASTEAQRGWQGSWTIFYWGWWIAWGPFVGMFIARISRGRTIREYLLGVLIVPTLVTFMFLSVLGAAGLYYEIFTDASMVSLVNADFTKAFFDLLSMMSDSGLLSAMTFLSIVMLVVFFVTSSDSGTLVICTLLSFGNEDPPKRQRVFWGMTIGIVAGALLFTGGTTALKAVQAASIVAALPFSFILIALCWGLLKSLREESAATASHLATAKPQGKPG